MDDILQRMLTVDKQAEAIVAEADREAENLLVSARRTAAEDEERLKRETVVLAETLIHTRVDAAEARKTATLDKAVTTLKSIEQELRQKVAIPVVAVIRDLAYPQFPEPSRPASP